MANSLVWARAGCLFRAGYLTPYFAETLAEDVRRGGRVRLKVGLSADADEAEVDQLRRRLAALPADIRLRRRGTARDGAPAQRASRRS